MTEKIVPFYPPFASGIGTYPAGGNPWSSGANKIISNARGTGFTPAQQMAAEYINYELFLLGSQANIGIHNALRDWSVSVPSSNAAPQYPVGIDGEAWDRDTCIDIGAFFPSDSTQGDVPLLVSNAPSGADKIIVSGDGVNWTRFDGPGNGSGQIEIDTGDTSLFPLSFAGCGGLPLVGGNKTGNVARALDFDLTTWNIADSGLAHVTALKTVKKTGSLFGYRILAGGYGTSNQIAYSDDSGLTWTTVSISGFAQVRDRSVVNFAHNLDGTKIVASTLNADMSPPTSIAYSTDWGTSWTKVDLTGLALPGNRAKAAIGVTYNDTWGLFMAVGGGQFAVSSTGASWTRYVAAGGSSEMLCSTFRRGITATGRHVCSLGPAICVLTKIPFVGDKWSRSGIYYTLDMGATWNFADLGAVNFLNTDSPEKRPSDPLAIRNIGGRLFAWGYGTIYRSRSIILPDSDLRYVPG